MGTQSENRLLDGKAVAAEIRRDITDQVDAMVAGGARRPKLVAVLVGDNAASAAYVRNKTRTCEKAGVLGETLRLPSDVDQATLEDEIRRLNDDDSVDGILVQLPLPRSIDERPILELVRPDKDVDGFHPENVGRLWIGEPALAPATPTGVVEMLRRCDIPLSGQHAVVVGRSNIVGKPMASLLLRENCTVTVCHSRTRDLAATCRDADILVVAIGRAAMVGPDHVREGAVVIDVGMNRIDDAAQLEHLHPGDRKRRRGFDKRGYALVGDVDFHRVAPKASAITPVPGGVGPLTVVSVLSNTVAASKRRQGVTP
ncbi:MAG: bifunctional methylenetetrahydrofolate dehydrogenase/methenyltetrahydrofolate cyclohydrolase FolD [Acidobacteriota bacterium]